jgi:hypothetical protein
LPRRDFLTLTARGALSMALSAGLTLPRGSAAPLPRCARLHADRPFQEPNNPFDITADILVYGATVAGIAAAIQAARMNRSVVLLAFDSHLGGMTAGGLSATDITYPDAVGGIAREFYQRLGVHYDRSEAWYFEPHIAEATLHTLCAEAGVSVLYRQRLMRVEKRDGWIVGLSTEGGQTYRASYFVDASYEGDLMAAAGVSYTVGREGNAKYGETLNGLTLSSSIHDFSAPVDPYVVAGKPTSGLLPGVALAPSGRLGDGGPQVQAYCFRLCVTNAKNRLPFPKPHGYDPKRYALLLGFIASRNGTLPGLLGGALNPLPPVVGKWDANDWGPVSFDNIGANWRWPEGSYAVRAAIFQDHINYQQGFLWFLGNDPRVPAPIRASVAKYGLPVDEFTNTGGWPHHLYIREARRMVSDYVMTEHNVMRAERPSYTVSDGIGVAYYTIDSHATQRVVSRLNGAVSVRNEGLVQRGPILPFAIPYRAIVPRAAECANLLVPICLSASHVAWGSIRVEPTFFVLGQSAGTAACQALDAGGIPVQQVDIPTLQARLQKDGQVVEWPVATTHPA